MRALMSLIAALALLTGCAGQDRAPNVTVAPVADWAVPASAEFLPITGLAGGKVDVTFDIVERGGYSLRSSAMRDTVAILRQASTDYPGRAVLVAGRIITKDSYGNTGPKYVLNAFYEPATIARINFTDIDPTGIWDIRDGGNGFTG